MMVLLLLTFCIPPFENKKSLTKQKRFTKDEFNIRGATLIYGKSRTLNGIQTYPRQLTYALTSWNTRLIAFDHALGGPFSNLHLDPAPSLPDSLCAHLLLLSPLQRFVVFIFIFLTHQLQNVNGFFKKIICVAICCCFVYRGI